ncbi:GNAT family N-acetyltransferase [Capillimicrobium parvum]|uniref:Phosphinothricin acetyltransferase YwnH n=1 Tax=Capillimicrobium parvum TaxID=2884022 RepID=A0A9E6XVR2_9ACTN|nr:GNAT family N-acetyltransferase [Capillimicrobium parvum]UGS34988.1 Putative phosphinothricin acetyltransferase YwnH [Capillimicrobium parvum]
MPVRDARPADLERIVAIYNASIPGRLATADLEPVTVDERRAWLLERDATRRPVWVTERDGEVAGWLSVGDFYGRPAYAATVEVGVYVDPAHQRCGVGRELLDHLVANAPQLGLRRLLAFVFAHNAPSLALFERAGFERWGLLPEVAELDGRLIDSAILGLRVA